MSHQFFVLALTKNTFHCRTNNYRYQLFSLNRLQSSARPSLDDVERISKGQAAKKRGVGSRQVPHRLNAEERIEWDNAKKRGYLQLRGTGWRRERGDSPLANIYRQLCDAKNIPCITIAKGLGIGDVSPAVSTARDLNSTEIEATAQPTEGESDFEPESGTLSVSAKGIQDVVVIDFSPLRLLSNNPTIVTMAQICLTRAKDSKAVLRAEDFSDVKEQGWDSSDIDLDTMPIWRIPVYCVKAVFINRAEAKKYAEVLVQDFKIGSSN